MRKKLLSILALLCLTVSSAWADDGGTCGTNLTWSYVESTHTLTISGTGAMDDYDVYPWFDYTSDISAIVIEEGVTSISDYALAYCYNDNLTTINIPNSVTTIGNYAFYGCLNLTTVNIGSGVTSIGDRAFERCSSLTDITVSGENTNFKSVDNVLFTYDGKKLIQYPAASTATSYVIPDGVETIGASAFADSDKLTTVTIPNSVTTIGEGAFLGCIGLTEVTIPNSVTTIGDYAFSYCYGLTTVNIGSGVTSIGDGAFESCGSLTSITVSGENTNFKSVNNVLFTYDGKRLIQYPAGSTATSYVIPDGVETIGAYAFSGSDKLTTVTIPNGVTTIGNCAFYECSGLTTMSIPDGVETIGDNAFLECVGLTTMSIPSSVTAIGAGAFSCCENLTTVTLNSNPYIDDYAFDIDGYGTTPAVTMKLTATAAGDAKWMTFYNLRYSFEADASTQVFKAELDDATGALTLHEVTDKIVDADNAVILKSTGNPVMTLTTSASSDSQANSLEGVSDPEGEDNDGYFYVLNYKAATGVGFYKLADGKKLGYGKAFLWYDSSSAPSFFGFGDDATSIKSLTPDPSPNGEGSEYYDLQGRRVAQPAKGLYIVNGKKVVIK